MPASHKHKHNHNPPLTPHYAHPPHYGPPVPALIREAKKRPWYRRPWILAGGGVFVLWVLGAGGGRERRESEAAASAAAKVSESANANATATAKGSVTEEVTPTQEVADEPEPEPTTPWTYHEFADAMTGEVTRRAMVTSNNTIELDFPYQGGTTATLKVREHPRHGTDVILEISKGQITCGFRGCKILVRFDDQPPVRFRATGPADHSSDTLFLSPATKIIGQLKRSQVARVEIPLYQAGAPVFEFTTEGLEWAPSGKGKAGKKK